MASLNKVQLIGNLGQDPEIKYLADGMAVCAVSLATNERWKDKQTGEPKEKTEWHRIVVWGKQAENVAQYLNKGSLAYFEGQLQTRKWTDKGGVERYTTEIRASNVTFLGAPGTGRRPEPDPAGGEQPAARPAARPAQDYREASRGDPRPQSTQGPSATYSNMDEDIPF